MLSARIERAILLLVFVSVSGVGAAAHACDGDNPEQYRSDKTVWCVDPSSWSSHQNEIKRFFAYGDSVISRLTDLFGVTPQGLPFTIVARKPDGGAQTPTRYGPGVEVTADAYYGSSFGVDGFYGYLLTLHEFINQYTGLVSGGWPTDWWADHRSPYPNSLDAHVLSELGKSDAAAAQSKRFNDRSSSEYDAEVGMFDDLFDAYGFDGFKLVFDAMRRDGMKWDGLKDPPSFSGHNVCKSGNPSLLLSEYVIAYLSLPARKDVSPGLIAAGVGKKPSNWPDDPCDEYTPQADVIGDIADAHCALAAASGDKSHALTAFRNGDYANDAIRSLSASCGGSCPSECGCKAGRCVVSWRAEAAADGGSGGKAAAGAGTKGGDGGRAAAGAGGRGAAGHAASGADAGVSDGGSSAQPDAGMQSDDAKAHGGASSCGCGVVGSGASGAHSAFLAALASALLWMGPRRRRR